MRKRRARARRVVRRGGMVARSGFVLLSRGRDGCLLLLRRVWLRVSGRGEVKMEAQMTVTGSCGTARQVGTGWHKASP